MLKHDRSYQPNSPHHLRRPDLHTLAASSTIPRYSQQGQGEVSNVERDDHGTQSDAAVDDALGAAQGDHAVSAVVEVDLPACFAAAGVVEADAADFAVHPDAPLDEPACRGVEELAMVLRESTGVGVDERVCW